MSTLLILLAVTIGLSIGAYVAIQEQNRELEAPPKPKQVEPPKPPKRVFPPPPKTPRTITWIRVREKPKLLYTKIGDEKPVADGIEELGMEEYRGPALYDNGLFAVIDSTKELVYDIIKQVDDPHGNPKYSRKKWVLVKRVNLDFEHACQEADGMRKLLEDHPDIPM